MFEAVSRCMTTILLREIYEKVVYKKFGTHRTIFPITENSLKEIFQENVPPVDIVFYVRVAADRTITLSLHEKISNIAV